MIRAAQDDQKWSELMQKQKDQFDDQFERQQREHEKQLQAARMEYENLLNSVTSVAKNWHSGQQVSELTLVCSTF